MDRFEGGWCSPEQFDAARKDRLRDSDLSRMQTGIDGFYNLIVAYRVSARILPVTINHVKRKSSDVHEVDFRLEVPDGSEEFSMKAKLRDGEIGRRNAILSPLNKLGRLPSAAFFADAHWNGTDSTTISGYDYDLLDILAKESEEDTF